MCGLVAVISKYLNGFSDDQREMFDNLLYVDVLRGEDSTGAFVVSNLGNVEMAKEAGEATFFMATDAYKTLRNSAFGNGWAMVGHNRKATRGTINDKNAHPFIVDDRIVLVHNGSYFGDHKKLKDTEVDSEAIAHRLAEENNPEIALRSVDAAYALIWYDVDNKTLNMVRNHARPLCMMETAGTYVIASEDAFLWMLKYRYKMQLTKDPFELPGYLMHSFKLEDDKSTTLTTRELDCSFSKYNSYKPPQTEIHQFGVKDEALVEGGEEYFCGQNWREWAERHPPGLAPYAVSRDNNNNHNACAYSSIQPANTINTMETSTVDKFMEAIRSDMVTITYGDYVKIKDQLSSQPKIKVIINDVQEADNIPKSDNFILIGKTLQNNHIYATFHIKEKDFSRVVQNTHDSIFEVTYNGLSWRREEENTKKPMEEWKGVAILHGRDPVPIYTGETHNVVQ